MPDHDPYEAWKRRRADVSVLEDFAERVMASLRHQPPRWQLDRWLRHLLGSSLVRVGICSLACAVGLFRALQVVAFFLPSQ
jgi:hypothetical protein